VKVFTNILAHNLFCSFINEKTAGIVLLFCLISTGEDLDDLHPLITDFLFGFYGIVQWGIVHLVIHDAHHDIVPAFK
jgi:hypothetical protein